MAEYNGMEPRSSIDDMPSIKCRVDSHEIPTLVQMYRALIVRCVKADDIVHHLEEVISTSTLTNTYKTNIVIFFIVKIANVITSDLSANVE